MPDTTFGDMTETILSEIKRPQLRTQVQQAIRRAMKHYDKMAFWFHEQRAANYLIPGQVFYDLPDDFQYPSGSDPLEITVGNDTYPLTRRTWDYLQRLDNGTEQGIPTEWAFFQNQFRVFPKPDGDYVITLSYIKRAADVSEAADTNGWCVEGEELVRYRAKWDLYQNTIRDVDMAAMMKVSETEAYAMLASASGRKQSSGRIVPHYL